MVRPVFVPLVPAMPPAPKPFTVPSVHAAPVAPAATAPMASSSSIFSVDSSIDPFKHFDRETGEAFEENIWAGTITLKSKQPKKWLICLCKCTHTKHGEPKYTRIESPFYCNRAESNTFVVPMLYDVPKKFVTYCVMHAGELFPVNPFNLFVYSDTIIYPKYENRLYNLQAYRYDGIHAIPKDFVVGDRPVKIPVFIAEAYDINNCDY